ncbi:exonuclease domain-containing protein [Marinitoga hydrogenitolerans]|uniref:exonuclease domain-containing protein n=1 Tax=Marinitoga hydrogenitolerans TaxID=287990 RepID=UPI0009328E6D
MCLLDTETTVLNLKSVNRIIEIVIYNIIITEKSNYYVKEKFVTYIYPERTISLTRCKRITPEVSHEKILYKWSR